MNIEQFLSSAIDIVKENYYFKVVTQCVKVLKAKKVILCLGSLSGDNFPDLSNIKNFFNHFCNFDEIKERKIFIIGSGLTAVDIFRSLNKREEREIHMFSRTGIPPTCLTTKNTYFPKYLNWANLQKVPSHHRLNYLLRH